VFSDFTPHLEELRRRALLCLAVFFLISFAAYFFARPLLDFLTQPIHGYPGAVLVFQKPHEAFLIHLRVAAFTGILLASPLFFIQGWLFVAPGLYEKEKRTFLPIIITTILLFFIGVLFSYYFVIPFGLKFLLGFGTESLRPMINVAAYFSFLTGMLLAFGLLFDFPVILIGLVSLGVVKTAVLSRSRKVIVVILFIAAAALTPSPDPLSQLLLAFPLWGLFEISLIIARIKEKGSNRATEPR
jgi:sec-independent protein translocase protein TatC